VDNLAQSSVDSHAHHTTMSTQNGLRQNLPLCPCWLWGLLGRDSASSCLWNRVKENRLRALGADCDAPLNRGFGAVLTACGWSGGCASGGFLVKLLWVSPAMGKVSCCARERLLEKNGRSDGFGVDEMLIVSISGPESLISSSSSKRSAMSVGSMSPPNTFAGEIKHL
jgi:hypothetical protein